MLAEFAHPPQKMGQDKSYCQQWCVHPLSFYHRLTSHPKAGFIYDKMLHTMPDDVYDVIMKVHVRAPFRLIHAAAPYFRIKSSSPENRTIINVSSTTGLHGNVGQANYAAAKAAVVGLTKTICKEWGVFGVRANTIAFGMVHTRFVFLLRLASPVCSFHFFFIQLDRRQETRRDNRDRWKEGRSGYPSFCHTS